MPICTQHNYV